MFKKLLLLAILINFSRAQSLYARGDFYKTDNCSPALTFHGRTIECGFITISESNDNTEPISNAKIFKYFKYSNSKISFTVKNGDATNMKYKALLPNVSSTQILDLDSKLPYFVMETTDGFSDDTPALPNSFRFQIAIFSCNNDLDDFLYENTEVIYNKKYGYKKPDETFAPFNNLLTPVV